MSDLKDKPAKKVVNLVDVRAARQKQKEAVILKRILKAAEKLPF